MKKIRTHSVLGAAYKSAPSASPEPRIHIYIYIFIYNIYIHIYIYICKENSHVWLREQRVNLHPGHSSHFARRRVRSRRPCQHRPRATRLFRGRIAPLRYRSLPNTLG